MSMKHCKDKPLNGAGLNSSVGLSPKKKASTSCRCIPWTLTDEPHPENAGKAKEAFGFTLYLKINNLFDRSDLF